MADAVYASAGHILQSSFVCVVGDAQANVTYQGNSTPFAQIFHPERQILNFGLCF